MSEALSEYLLSRGDADAAERIGHAGEVWDGWQLKAFLGLGGSGEVWRVCQVESGRAAALKLLHHDTPANHERFLREVKFLRRNRHPGFPRCLQVGERTGRPFAVFELLEPCVLPARDRAVARFVGTVADAVGHLHRLGFIHRDIKPSNILLRAARRPVLIDLGLMKEYYTDASPAYTVDELSVVNGRMSAKGTPGFSAPEQFVGGAVSPASDIHSLGVLIDACFAGAPPAAWRRIIERCTSSLPQRRIADIAEFKRAIRWRHLQRWAWGLGLAALALVAALVGWGRLAAAWRAPAVADAAAGSADAPPLYVSAAPAADADGTEAHPYGLAEALARAESGQQVLVAPGDYPGAIVLNRQVRLKSLAGPLVTRLCGERGQSVVQLNRGADATVIDGFTITGGTGQALPSAYVRDYFGGGVCCEASGQLRNCLITGNGQGEPRQDAATFGGGVCVRHGTVTLVNCVVSNNFAWASGGGVFAETGSSSLVLKRCTVAENGSTEFFGNQGGLALADFATASVCDSLFFGNSGEQLGAFGGPYARGTRAEVTGSYVEGGVRAGAIVAFQQRQNLAERPRAGEAGADLSIRLKETLP